MIRFLSFAFVGQILAVGNQLILLPLQIHTWGNTLTAAWLGALALTAFAGVCDAGLRYVGYSVVQSGDKLRCANLWSAIRFQMALGGLATAIGATILFGANAGPMGYLAIVLLSISMVLDQVVLARATIGEGLGHIVKQEGLFTAANFARVVLSIIAIAVFKASPIVVAAINLLTSLANIIFQGRMQGFAEWAPMLGNIKANQKRAILRDAAWTLAYPLSSWVQLQLPVLVLSLLARPDLVTLYVVVRVVFGIVRMIVMQVSRVATIRFMGLAANGERADGVVLVTLLACAALWLALGAGLTVFADNFSFVGMLAHAHATVDGTVFALALGLSAMFAINQFVLMAWLYEGAIARSCKMLYFYSAGLTIGCAATLLTKSYLPMVCGLVLCDVLLTAVLYFQFWRDEPVKGVRDARNILIGTSILYLAPMIGAWWLWMGSDKTTLSLARLDIAAIQFGIAWTTALAAGALLALFIGRPLVQILRRPTATGMN